MSCWVAVAKTAIKKKTKKMSPSQQTQLTVPTGATPSTALNTVYVLSKLGNDCKYHKLFTSKQLSNTHMDVLQGSVHTNISHIYTFFRCTTSEMQSLGSRFPAKTDIRTVYLDAMYDSNWGGY